MKNFHLDKLLGPLNSLKMFSMIIQAFLMIYWNLRNFQAKKVEFS